MCPGSRLCNWHGGSDWCLTWHREVAEGETDRIRMCSKQQCMSCVMALALSYPSCHDSCAHNSAHSHKPSLGVTFALNRCQPQGLYYTAALFFLNTSLICEWSPPVTCVTENECSTNEKSISDTLNPWFPVCFLRKSVFMHSMKEYRSDMW